MNSSTPWSLGPEPRFQTYFINAGADFGQKLTDHHKKEGYFSKRLRGNKMPSEKALYDEIAAGMQFPYYFGYNRNAFDECISDLGDQEVGKGVCMTLTDAHLLLSESPPDVFEFLADSLRRAGRIWSTPINEAQEWDRDAKPFIVTLFSPVEQYGEVIRQWAEQQIDLIQLPIPDHEV